MYNHFALEIPENERNRQLLADIRKAAEEYQTQTIKDLPFSQYMIYFQTGSRLEYEACYMEHRRRLNVYAIMALATKDERWTKGLEDILWAICNEYTWAFPAHLKDVSDILECAVTIDLFAAETGIALSEICYILRDIISPIVRDRVELEVRRRIISPYKERNLKFHADNWSAVCAGGVGIAAMYWGGWEEYLTIHDKVSKSIQDFIDSYQEDGCCLEGALYWGYGFGYFTYYAEMLRELSGGSIDLFRNHKIEEIALFPSKVYLEQDKVIPFADTPHNFRCHIGLIHFLAKEYDAAELLDADYTSGFDEDFRHRFAELIRDIFWYDPEFKKERRKLENETVCHIFRQSQWYINKQKRYTFAVKGGRNNEPHNHNDLGSFILYSEGKYIIDDLGWPKYDSEYFGTKRYENLCASSAGHSVPILNGTYQKRGRQHTTTMRTADDHHVSFEIAGAYEDGICSSLVRTFQIERERVVLEDVFQVKTPGEIRERFITRIAPVIQKNTVIIAGWKISCRNEKFMIKIIEKNFEPRLDICKMDMKPIETAYLIDFIFPKETMEKSFLFSIERI